MLYGHSVAKLTIVKRYIQGKLHATGSGRGGSGIHIYVYVWPGAPGCLALPLCWFRGSDVNPVDVQREGLDGMGLLPLA